MIFSRNLHEAAIAIRESGKRYFNEEFSIGQIKKHLRDKEYYAFYEKGLIGAAYFNGNDFHIGMIDKGYGIKAIKKLIKNRKVRAVINSQDARTIKLASYLGFKHINKDTKYTYMVKQ